MNQEIYLSLSSSHPTATDGEAFFVICLVSGPGVGWEVKLTHSMLGTRGGEDTGDRPVWEDTAMELQMSL